MPVLVLSIPEDFDKLFQNGGLTAVTALGKPGGIMKVTIYTAVVLVVAVLRSEDGGTHGTSKVFNVVFTVQSCYV